MDNSTYRHLLSKIKKSAVLPHHNYPSHNLLSVDSLTKVSHNLNFRGHEFQSLFLTNFPFYQQFPYVVYKSFPFFCGSGVTDEAFEFLKKKLKWEKDLNNLKLFNFDKAVKQVKDLKENRAVKISNNLRKVINHFHADPEPTFQGNYNWLHTDGTLSYTESNLTPILICSDSFGKKPAFNILKLNENLDEIDFKLTSTLKTFSPVLQITSKACHENVFVCVRQKNSATLYGLDGRDFLTQPRKIWRKKVDPPKLITCLDIRADCEQVLISDSCRDLHVFDVQTTKKVLGVVGRRIMAEGSGDCWSRVAFGDEGLYLALRNCFVVIDPRNVESSAKLVYNPSPALNGCEEICSFVKSSTDSNSVYLGTTHSLLQMDLRKGETVQKWTHLMKKPPQFLTSTPEGDAGEILLLQSDNVSELSGIVNESLKKGNGENCLSRSLPCLLNNIERSLRVARFHGHCLCPSIAQRVSFAVTGLHCVKNKSGDYNIFTANSAGDIFLSKLEKKREDELPREKDEEEIIHAMKLYESHVEKISLQESGHPQLKWTDMSRLVEDLKRPSSARRSQRNGEVWWKYHEMFAPESLEFCRDLLAPRFLKVWGYGTADSELGEKTMSVEEKVRQWMHKN